MLNMPKSASVESSTAHGLIHDLGRGFAREFAGGSPRPLGSRGKGPVGGLWDKFLQKLAYSVNYATMM